MKPIIAVVLMTPLAILVLAWICWAFDYDSDALFFSLIATALLGLCAFTCAVGITMLLS